MREDYDYLIVGAGMAADSAARAIRERDETGTIGILGEENTPPVARPPLSKDLWTDADSDETSAALDTASTGATIHLGTRATRLDRDAKVVSTEAGDEFGYGQVLLTTGAHPRTLPDLPAGDRVIYYRTLADYQRLRALVADHKRVAVVGGGYIGSELAAALSGEGASVTVLFPEPALLSMMFPAELRPVIEKKYVDAGVRLRPGTMVRAGRVDDEGVHLDLDDGSTLDADVAVVGLGVVPNGELAGDSGLELAEDGGIVVDKHLRTLDPAVLAAGDVAVYPDRLLGQRRVEHEDNAVSQGTVAGHVMAGPAPAEEGEDGDGAVESGEDAYDHTPMFYSDLFDLGYEAVGRLDASLDTEVVDKGDGAAVVYYLDGGKVVGVLLWGVWDSVDAATEVIAAGKPKGELADLI